MRLSLMSWGHTNHVVSLLLFLFRECGEYDSALCDLSEALRLSPPGGNSRDLLRFAAKVREEAKERERTNNNSDRKGEDGVSFGNSEKWFRANVGFFYSRTNPITRIAARWGRRKSFLSSTKRKNPT